MAFATDLSSGEDPAVSHYCGNLRDHMIGCMEGLLMKVFPKGRERRIPPGRKY